MRKKGHQIRLLITYGYHLKERYATEVGEKFRGLDLENVIVAKWKGIRGLARNAQFRRDVGAKYAIDLHDSSPIVNRFRGVPFYDRYGYHVWIHAPYDKAVKLLYPFKDGWNSKHEYGEECMASGCDCYPRDQLHPCRLDVLICEFELYIPKTVDQGVNFLRELVKHLRDHG